MQLSKAMKEHLKFHLQLHGSTQVKAGRPYHHGNLVTHDALIRRGLLAEAKDRFRTTTLTDKGLEIARTLGV